VSAPLRVVVADDHPVFREGLVTVLGDLDGVEVVAQVASGEEAVDAVDALEPDVVVMDLRMPGDGGVAATARLSAKRPQLPVLVLTMSEDDDSLFAALRAGARGYLLKEASTEQIAQGLRAVARGEAVFGARIADRVLAFFTASRTSAAAALPFPQLTDREREVLDLVARGLPNAAIAARLFLSDKTVRNNVSACLAKLQVASRAEAVAVARDAGLGGPQDTPRPGNSGRPPPAGGTPGSALSSLSTTTPIRGEPAP
jgi:DNA-binding NarL/FixJ family response regulator